VLIQSASNNPYERGRVRTTYNVFFAKDVSKYSLGGHSVGQKRNEVGTKCFEPVDGFLWTLV
jgi:hypothetical protein